MAASQPPISLAECVRGLVAHLPHPGSNIPTKDTAALYVAAVGFLYHLKKDQARLHQILKRKQNEIGAGALFPPSHLIPAITTVLQDPDLFPILVACLKAPPTELADSSEGTQSTPHLAGRKRSCSFQASDVEASKHQKTQDSPIMKREVVDAESNSGEAEPSVQVQVVAATILYVAFQHLDHWPAPLAQAYAEDCFGSRSWVDDDRCSLLVQNLALVHAPIEEEPMLEGATLAAAREVSDFYSHLMKCPSIVNLPETKAEITSSRTLLDRCVHSRSNDSVQLGLDADQNDAFDSESDPCDNDERSVQISSVALEREAYAESEGSSSSSGEEDEEVLDTAESFRAVTDAQALVDDSIATAAQVTFPIVPSAVDMRRVRPRYVGQNLESARAAIGLALGDRIDARHKQNSRLVTTLSSFLTVPEVRCVVAQSLEKWLQSPALSGQARSLFGELVNNIKNVDPPLSEDIHAIDSLLAMRLKTNQLNMQIEYVTQIAARLPSTVVALQILSRLLRTEKRAIEEDPGNSPTQALKMVAAINAVLQPQVFSDSLARATMALLEDEREALVTHPTDRVHSVRAVQQIRHLLRSVASLLGPSFDGYAVLESLASFGTPALWSIREEEDRARLLFECALLLEAQPVSSESKGARKTKRSQNVGYETGTDRKIEELRSQRRKTRKVLLRWCCATYVPIWRIEFGQYMPEKMRSTRSDDDSAVGAGPPDFRSFLTGDTDLQSQCPGVMQCLLFMVNAESVTMREFLNPGDPTAQDKISDQLRNRIDDCFRNGTDLDDAMIWIVLDSSVKSGAMPVALALSLIECLFRCGIRNSSGGIHLRDPQLVWELYQLAEYQPELSLTQHAPRPNSEESHDERGEQASLPDLNAIATSPQGIPQPLPRLAYPGMWWRVTTIALVMCGRSPSKIGAEMWLQHPTLCALMKMVTSDRYRFPTVECDDAARERMKADESKMRSEELRISELLFLPPASTPSMRERESTGLPRGRQGERVSARQRDKQEKLIRQQRENEASEAEIAVARRRRYLRSAQRSIMIWDPRGTARKPPRESVSLILAAGEIFNLSDEFRRCVEPDYLLMTVGQTTRDAIERASDWMIRVISSYPKIIERLPSSGSCFLLLRAYGNEDDGKSELRNLSLPLLQHVSCALKGGFGDTDAVEAAQLLLADMDLEFSPDRRLCARRVLIEALKDDEIPSSGAHLSDTTGLQALLQEKYAKSIVPCAIEHMTRAISFEHGNVLCDLVLALEQYINFSQAHAMKLPLSFDTVLCDLLSSRPHVCADAMKDRQDFLSQGVRVIYQMFISSLEQMGEDILVARNQDAVLLLPYKSTEAQSVVSLPLLHSICVLLSIWSFERCEEIEREMNEIGNALLPDSILTTERAVKAEREGIASSTLLATGDCALSAQYWVMLSKSRNHEIGRRATLSTPDKFLPRLLLCSGLPDSSINVIIRRLDMLGDTVEGGRKAYAKLFSSSEVDDWAYTGSQALIPRRILGRLAAHSRLREFSCDLRKKGDSLTFLEWLSDECRSSEDEAVHKASRKEILWALDSSHLNSSFRPCDTPVESVIGNKALISGSRVSATARPLPSPNFFDLENVQSLIAECIQKEDLSSLEPFLEHNIDCFVGDPDLSFGRNPAFSLALSAALLGSMTFPDPSLWFPVVLKWAPLVSRNAGSPDLWRSLFASKSNLDVTMGGELVSRCVSLWSRPHSHQCRQWLLSAKTPDISLDVARIVHFLVLSSEEPSVHPSCLVDEARWSQGLAVPQQTSQAGISLAIKCAASCPDLPSTFKDRNGIPHWLTQLLSIGCCGMHSVGLVVESLLAAIQDQNEKPGPGFCDQLPFAVLRIYMRFPRFVDFGEPALRDLLMEGARTAGWREWRSPLDFTIQNMIAGMVEGLDRRLLQQLSDIARNHPLLFLRNLALILHILEKDATPETCQASAGPGRVDGKNHLGLTEGRTASQLIRISVVDWGYSFTDTLWCSIVDILLSIPNDILFGLGMKMGLPQILEAFVRLIFVHGQLRSKTSRVSGKFQDLLVSFRECSTSLWAAWLDGCLVDFPSLGTMRHVLIGCSLIEPSGIVSGSRR